MKKLLVVATSMILFIGCTGNQYETSTYKLDSGKNGYYNYSKVIIVE